MEIYRGMFRAQSESERNVIKQKQVDDRPCCRIKSRLKKYVERAGSANHGLRCDASNLTVSR